MEITCYKCNETKDIINFAKNKSKKFGVNTMCKSCSKEYMKKYNLEKNEIVKKCREEYKRKNKKKLKEQSNEYYKKNKEKISEYQKKYRELNREDLNQKNKKYRNEKSESRRLYKREWQKRNRKKIPWYYAHRDILNRTIKSINIKKTSRTENQLGYSSEDLKIHIESLFLEGMSWENYGDWHIDHIRPLSTFNENDDASLVNSLDNLKPLWREDNLKKYNKYGT
jgi:hypothetical protein